MVCCDEPRSLFSTSKAPPVQNIMSFYLNKSFLQKKLFLNKLWLMFYDKTWWQL